MLLALAMLVTCAMPGFAAVEGTGSGISDSDAVSNEDIQAVCSASLAEKNAIESGDAEAIVIAFAGFMDVSDIFNSFDTEHMETLAEMMGLESADDAWNAVLSAHIDAGIINDLSSKIEAFAEDADAGTAKELVDYYDSIFSDPNYDDPDLRALVRRCFPDVDDTYNSALALLPSRDVLSVFEAYTELESAIASLDFDTLSNSLEEFDKVVDIFNGLSESDLEALGSLMGCTGEEAFSAVQDISINANVVARMGIYYTDYANEQNRLNAVPFVEYYEDVFNDPYFVDSELRELVREFFWDIDSLYEMALDDSLDQQYIRLSGKTRVETSVAVSREMCESSEFVVIASGKSYADALAGVPLAFGYCAPVLLMDGTASDEAVYEEIDRLNASWIYILGGEAAVSKNVDARLKEKGCTVDRLSGKTRHETAAVIGEAVVCGSSEVDEVFIVSAENYPDALSIGTVASVNNIPILYIESSGRLNASTAQFLSERNVKKATIIGGTGAIGASAEANIKACGVEKVERIYGKDRYATCLEIIEAYEEIFLVETVFVATGENYPDALAGGAYASGLQAPVLLVNNKALSGEQSAFLEELAATGAPGRMYVLGGTGAVTDSIAQAAAEALLGRD